MRNPIETFLSTRCSPQLIAEYYTSNPISNCIPRSLSNITDHDNGLNILSKLLASGLLSEETRQDTVKRVIYLSEETHSCRFAECPNVKILFTELEEQTTAERISNSLLLNVEEIIENLKNSWSPTEDPEDLFSEIDKSLEFIELDKRFCDDTQSEARLRRSEIKEVIRSLDQNAEDQEYDELDTEQAIEVASSTIRSVFDDVDE